MKISTVTTTNSKGQIVIPRLMREALQISPQKQLHIKLSGHGIFIEPVQELVANINTDSSYVKMLQKTQGSWDEVEQKTKKSEAKKSLELQASKKRKKTW